MTKGLRDQAEGRILWWMTLGLTVAAYWLCASNILFTRTMALCSAISVVVMWAAADWLWRRIRPAVHRRLFRVTRLEEGHDEAPARPSERGRMRQARRFEMAMNLLLPLAAFSLGTFGTQNAVGLLASAYFSRTGVYPHLNWYSDPNPVILSRFPVPSWMDDYQKLLDVVGKAPQSTITVRYEGDDGRTRLLKFTRAPGLGFVMQVVRAQGLCQYSTCTGCCQAADGMFHVTTCWA